MATSKKEAWVFIALIMLVGFVSSIIAGRLGIHTSWFTLLAWLWIAVALWVFRDAGARGMQGMLWGLLVLVGNIIGLLIYLIVRNEEILIVRNEETERFHTPVSTSTAASNLCPSCKRGVQAGFAYCPHCGSKMKAECRNCKKPVSDEWQLCPYCGERLVKPTPEGE
jgi:RNA polymerase subunit RPABC4/transcription elongation factor Spt4